MCGITGIFDPRLQLDLDALVQRMTPALEHRGPDDAGVHVDRAAGIALGFRRLSIIDLSPLGKQPMASPSGRYVITYNGEVYNHLDLRRDLEAQGVVFRGHSDTEALVAGAERWGPRGMVERLDGIFAFALWDREERRLHLARDRIGVKPLYYAQIGGAIYWGSELKAIRAGLAARPPLDLQAVAQYLDLGYVAGPRTIYEGVTRLAPGTLVSCGAGGISVETYWSLQAEAWKRASAPFDAGDDELERRFEGLLREVVRSQMMSDVPLGAFLSGGIDSSLVVAMMQAEAGRRVRTYTIGVEDVAYDEAAHARRIAEHLGTEHVEHVVTADDAKRVAPELPTFYDEPFSDSSQIPTYIVSRLARSGVTVSLSGDGGDELFGGYVHRYVGQAGKVRRVAALPPSLRRVAASVLAAGSRGLSWLPAAARRLAARATGDRLVEEKLGRAARLLGQPDAGRMSATLLAGSFAAGLLRADLRARAIPEDPVGHVKIDEAFDLVSWMMVHDQLNYLPDDILVKVDRASMAVSLEARVPLLDNRVVDFAWQLPRRLKLAGGVGKRIFRRVLARHVPLHLFERPKSGFGVPIETWLRGGLREWASDLLDPSSVSRRGILDAGKVHRLWQGFQGGLPGIAGEVWTVVMLEAWLERWA